MIVCRQSNGKKQYQAKDYIPCKFCLGFYFSGDMKRHCHRCVHKKESSDSFTGIQMQCELLLYPHKKPVGGSLELQEFVVRPMNNDEIKQVVMEDELILTYGSFIVSGKGLKKASNISQKMRILGRLVLEMRKNESMHCFQLKDCLLPNHFDLVVEATKRLAGFSFLNDDGENIPSFNKPSLALKLGYAFREFGHVNARFRVETRG